MLLPLSIAAVYAGLQHRVSHNFDFLVIDDEQRVRYCAEFIRLRRTLPAASRMRQFVLFLFSALSAIFGAVNRQRRNLTTSDG
jgi:hypothetical protein